MSDPKVQFGADNTCYFQRIIGTDRLELTMGVTSSQTPFTISNGNIGIGITAPTEQLHVRNDALIEGGNLFLVDTNEEIGSNGTDLFFKVGGSETVRFKSGGNVGIGTINPVNTLEVRNNTFIQGLFSSSASSGGIKLKNNGNYEWEIQSITSNNLFAIVDRNAGGLERFVINTSGNVGIGTTNPLNRLTLRQDQNAFSTIEIRNNNTTSLTSGSQIVFGSFRDNNPTDYEGAKIRAIHVDSEFGAAVKYADLAFYTQDNIGDTFAEERLRIKNTGNVGIGTTNPFAKLHVLDTATTSGTIDISEFFSSGLTTGTVQLKLGKEDAAGNTAQFKYIHAGADNNDNRLTIGFHSYEDVMTLKNNTGNVGIGNTNPVSFLQVEKNQNAATTFSVINTDTNTGSSVDIFASQSTSADDGIRMTCLGPNTTTVGGFVQDGGIIATGTNASGGLSLMARHTSSVMRFYTASTTAERMRIDASGNVGIGTTNPVALLTINTPTSSVTNRSSIAVFTGTAAASETIALTLGNNATAAIGNATSLTFSNASNYDGNCKISSIQKLITGTFDVDLAFSTRSTTVQERMRILGNGNVGIGTTDPLQELHIYGTNASASGPHIRLQTAGDAFPQMQILAWQHDAVSINFDAYFDTVWRSSDIGSNFNIQKLQDKLIFQYDSGITAGSTLTWEQGIVLDATGNVGIGTSTPAQKLSIRGTDSKIELRDTNGSPTIDLLRGGGTGAYGASAFADWRIQVPNADPDFTISSRYNSGANGGEWVRINFDNGNVGIGTTNPDSAIHIGSGTISSSPTTPGIRFGFSGGNIQRPGIELSGNTDIIIDFNKGDGTDRLASIVYGMTNNMMTFMNGGTVSRMAIGATGFVGIGTATPNFLLDLYAPASQDAYININRATTGNNSGIQFRDNSAAEWSMFSRGSDNAFLINEGTSTNRIFIKQGGNVGIGTTDPSSTLQVSGGIRTQVTTLTTGTHTLDGTHSIIRANTTGGSITINLPAVASSSGAEYKIIKVNASNTVTIDANSTELIDGTTTNITLSSIRDRIFLVCDGTEWYTF